MSVMLIKISTLLIPMVAFYIVGYGMLTKVNLFDAFIKGAKDGIKVVVEILPTLIGLMVAIAVIRESGVLDWLGEQFGKVLQGDVFPKELMPLVLIKMVSSSAATGLLLDLYKNYGTDSRIGTMASILMSCSETIFYTMAVYFAAAKVRKGRYTLLGALFATLVGILATICLV